MKGGGRNMMTMDYGNMDILDIVRELKRLLHKFSELNKVEMEEVRVLSNNLSAEISGWQYDTKIMEKYEKEYERIQRQ